MLVEKGDNVIVENPTYHGTLAIVSIYSLFYSTDTLPGVVT